MSQCTEEIIIAGFGGQGVSLAGKVLAQAAMHTGREVTYMPSYGAEVRGGTSNCMVIVADEPIASPVISSPQTCVVMNKASFDKFAPRVRTGGLLIVNSSRVTDDCSRQDIEVVPVAADEIATAMGSPRSANMVMLGAYLAKRGLVTLDDAAEALPEVLAERHHKTLPLNIEAIRKGAELIALYATQ